MIDVTSSIKNIICQGLQLQLQLQRAEIDIGSKYTLMLDALLDEMGFAVSSKQKKKKMIKRVASRHGQKSRSCND